MDFSFTRKRSDLGNVFLRLMLNSAILMPLKEGLKGRNGVVKETEKGVFFDGAEEVKTPCLFKG